MNMGKRLGLVGGALVLALAGTAASGCGNGAGARFGNVKSSDMPEGEAWTGVYYNEVYGYLHLVESDGNITGRWRRTDQSHWGELSGNADGNVFHYTWTEHKYGAFGPSADSKGDGIFIYKMGKGEKDPPELDGKYGLEQSDSVGEWHCIKQLNVKPDLNSINGQNPTETTSGDRWR